MEDKEIAELIKPLGLTDTRIKFIKSMIAFMERDGEELYEYSNEELIDKIAENVYGASFKVGECCALYFKGYHCGIMPVDSGMKEKELPCVGFEYIRCSRGNKILSMQLRKPL